MIKVCVPGAAGRMGRMVIAEINARGDQVALAAAVEQRGHAQVGAEAAPGVSIGDDLAAGLARADVYIDFTTPAATRAAALVAAERGVAAVIGTTGLDDAAQAALDRLAERAPIVVAPNFSLGVNLLVALAERAARALGAEFDVEVVELHHRLKRDAPSGTAIALGEALAAGRGRAFGEVKRFAREGEVGARGPDEIGVIALRGGDVIGEHTVHFLGPGERLELTHRAGSRELFAAGAVRAAIWVAGRPAGRYGMRDVLGI